MKPAELCQELGVCRRTLTRYEEQGFITPVKFNSRSFRYRMADISALFDRLQGKAVA
jgi:predicted site-specific integrase-resolvase